MQHDDRQRRCLGLADRVSEFIDGELPDDLRRQVRAHLADCADCERFVESLRRIKAAGHLLREPELSVQRLAELSGRARRALGLD